MPEYYLRVYRARIVSELACLGMVKTRDTKAAMAKARKAMGALANQHPDTIQWIPDYTQEQGWHAAIVPVKTYPEEEL